MPQSYHCAKLPARIGDRGPEDVSSTWNRRSPIYLGPFMLAGLSILLTALATAWTPTDTALAIDSRMSRDSAIGRGVPASVAKTLEVREVTYRGFDGMRHAGQIVCAKAVCKDLVDLFGVLDRSGFPVRSAIPISAFGGSDSASMLADNTCVFAWRGIWGTSKPSWHSKGRALDLNPRENPAFRKGRAVPSDARFDPAVPGTLVDTSLAVRFLRGRQWKWGAHWQRVQDRQHFERSP